MRYAITPMICVSSKTLDHVDQTDVFRADSNCRYEKKLSNNQLSPGVNQSKVYMCLTLATADRVLHDGNTSSRTLNKQLGQQIVLGQQAALIFRHWDGSAKSLYNNNKQQRHAVINSSDSKPHTAWGMKLTNFF